MNHFISDEFGELIQCPSCVEKNYAEDSWLPATSEYFNTIKGRLIFSKCKACRSEVAARVKGIVPANDADVRRAA